MKSRNVAIDVPGFLFCIILLLLHSVEFKGIEPSALHFVGVYLREYELCFAVVVFDGYGRVMCQKLRLYIRIVIHLVEREAAERIGSEQALNPFACGSLPRHFVPFLNTAFIFNFGVSHH